MIDAVEPLLVNVYASKELEVMIYARIAYRCEKADSKPKRSTNDTNSNNTWMPAMVWHIRFAMQEPAGKLPKRAADAQLR